MELMELMGCPCKSSTPLFVYLGAGFKYYLFSPLPGEDVLFD